MLRRLNANSAALLKFIFRRERVRIFFWFLSLVSLIIAVPVIFTDMYSLQSERDVILETMKNPAMTAMVGPVYGEENYTLGVMFASEMLLFTILAVAIMNIFYVVRYTRHDEERGRNEVIRSLPVGRLAILTSVMTGAVIINLALSVITGLGLTLLGIESIGFEGSMLYGFCMGASGLFFASVTALFCQLCSTSRGATAYSFAALGVMYLVRATGDVGNETLSLISPLGFILRTYVYAENRWMPVFLMTALSLAVSVIAFYLNSVRDMDQSFIPVKPGRKKASLLLGTSTGLAVRLVRNTFSAWLLGLFVLGATYGSIMGNVEDFINGNEMLSALMQTVSGISPAEQFITMLMSVISMGSAIPALAMILKLRSEEKRGRTEHIIARYVSKPRIILDYLLISVVTGFVMQFASVFGLWAASSYVMETPAAFTSLLKSGMIYMPAILVMIGMAVFLTGLFPERTGFTWLYLGFSFFVVYMGKIMQLPEWTAKLSPFGNIPDITTDNVNYTSLIVLSVIAAILMVSGVIIYRKRDARG